MTVGEKIYALRTQAGYSQEEFAELIGVSRQSVSKWETSAVMPDTEYVVKICKILSISTDTLLMDGDLSAKSVDDLQQTPSLEISAEQPQEAYAPVETSKKLSIMGFVFSFFFGIVGLIISCLALKKEHQVGKINHFAVSGIAISCAKVYFNIVTSVVFGILYLAFGGAL